MTGSDEIKLLPIGLGIRVLHALRLFLSSIARVFFNLYYGSEGEKIPQINDEIIKLPAFVIAEKIRNKEVTSVEVLEAFIRRIRDVNSALNCFVEDRFEQAMKEARAADEIVQSGEVGKEELAKGKPLLGVPFTTKDCIAVKGLHHTAGVVLRRDVIADRDGDAIKLLRDKGAIIIGLTNVSELCMWWESHNHIYGRTKNAYNTTRIVGGSSGGEGCLQSAAGSAFGVGSDIGGSIRMPAFFNGVFGHKPSRHIVSNDGQYPVPVTELQRMFIGIGPITRHAVDLKPLLKIMAGENAAKLKLDGPVDIKGLKVFYQFENGALLTDPVDPEIKAALKKVLQFLQEEHNLQAEEKKIAVLRDTNEIWLTLMKGDKDSFGKMIMGKENIFAFCLEMVKNMFGLSGNTLIAIFTAMVDGTGPQYGSIEYKNFKSLRNQIEALFNEMLGDNGVFLYPTHPTPAPYHNEPLVKPMNFSYTAVINLLGLPATNVPLGLNKDGLPIGIQVVANHNNDHLCLAVAEELDKAFGGWIEPQSATRSSVQ